LDYDALAAGLNEAIPFNRHVGLRVEAVGPGRGVVTLPDGDHLHNHVGSQHAGSRRGRSRPPAPWRPTQPS
jgi:acyl-coenzyme A thioesterase PaaI-like protein